MEHTKIQERLAALRQQMKSAGVDACLIPTNDFHGSEYVGDYFKAREYISGFTGSAGTVVVMREQAGLWTDGRYFLQAEEQLAGTGITLYRMLEEGVPTVQEFLEQQMTPGQRLAFDGRMVSSAYARGLAARLKGRGVSILSSRDLVGEIWKDRPALSCEPVFELDVEYAGESRADKIHWIKLWMEQQKLDAFVISSLDDIAWLLNLRGGDVEYNPVFLSYLAVQSDRVVLFAQRESFSGELIGRLAQDGVSLCPYGDIYGYLGTLPAGTALGMDPQVVNFAMTQAIPSHVRGVYAANPTVLRKAVKNETEVRHEREAHIKDGVAVTKLIYWLKKEMREGNTSLTEISVSDRLEQFRQEGSHYLGQSFAPIAGYQEHGAIVHYEATPESASRLKPEGLLLLDTGGQYLEGTTDITRTICLGEDASPEEKKYYTAVLRGHLNLAAARFKQGCSGVALDYLARGPLWEMGCDYNHGTGHGVGYLLNVHEGPNAFRYRVVDRPGANPPLEPGMITSDEPGIYLTGRFGIRLENLIVCVAGEKNEYGQFLGFESLTMVPWDPDVIDVRQMTQRELELLNAYHRNVYETISPYLDDEQREWLEQTCRPLG